MKPEHQLGPARRRRRRARGRARPRRRLDRRLPRRPRREGRDAGRVPRPHPRGRALPATAAGRSRGSSSPGARPTTAPACQVRLRNAAPRPPRQPSGAAVQPRNVPGKTVKTEAVVLRSIRYGEADRILHLYSAARGRVDAIAKGVRKPRSRFGGRLEPFFRLDLVLHEGRGELLTVTGVSTVDGYPRLRSSGAGASTPAPAPATRCCGCSTRPSRTRPPTTCSAATSRCSTIPPRSARPARRDGARLPAEAGAGGRLLARAGLLRPLRRGRAPDRLLGRRRRRRLRRLRGGLLPALRGGAPVHGRRDRPAARRGARRRRSGALRQVERAVGETLEHHAHVQLRAAAGL